MQSAIENNPMPHTPANPDYESFVRAQFNDASFIQSLGIELVDLGPGWIDSRLTIRPDHMQQDGFVHAGVIATLADHSGGMAAGTLCEAGKKVLTVEYKINLLRPGIGQTLRCRSEVLKPGRTITVCESEVFAQTADAEKFIAKASVTLALV